MHLLKLYPLQNLITQRAVDSNLDWLKFYLICLKQWLTPQFIMRVFDGAIIWSMHGIHPQGVVGFLPMAIRTFIKWDWMKCSVHFSRCPCSRKEGLIGFYRGLAPTLVHVTPNVCVVFLVYELFMGWKLLQIIHIRNRIKRHS